MSENRSWPCRGLPALWWWLLSLLGLAALAALMLTSRQPVVETDLSTRTSEALQAANLADVSVNIQQRGRDVQLQGTVNSEQERTQAEQLAQAVTGVRVVDNQIEVAPASPATFGLQSRNGQWIVSGILGSQAEIDQLLAAAATAYGADKVVNELSVGERVASAPWLSGLPNLLSSLNSLDQANLQIGADGSALSGVASSDEEKNNALAQAQSVVGGALNDRVEVKLVTTPSLQVRFNDGAVSLTGTLPSQAVVDELVAMAAQQYGADKVTNQLVVNPSVVDTPGFKRALQLLTALPTANGEMKVDSSQVELYGSVADDAARSSIVSAFTAALQDTGLAIVDKLTVASPTADNTADTTAVAPASEATPVSAADLDNPQVIGGSLETPTPDTNTTTDPAATDPAATPASAANTEATPAETTATAPTQTAPTPEEQQAINTCQADLNAAIQDKQILFETNKAVIQRASLPILDAMVAVVKQCQDVINKRGIRIGGHTDSVGDAAYNQRLSQERADAVKAYLANAGLDTTLIESRGYGESDPIASNDTAAGRAQNRRISFDIIQQ